MMNFQIQLIKRQRVLPTTRDYIQLEESRLREEEDGTLTQWLAGE
jgi:cyclopropane-fatty-acyl-phospholipid synthase